MQVYKSHVISLNSTMCLHLQTISTIESFAYLE